MFGKIPFGDRKVDADSIKITFRKKGCEDVKLTKLAQNCVEWRVLVFVMIKLRFFLWEGQLCIWRQREITSQKSLTTPEHFSLNSHKTRNVQRGTREQDLMPRTHRFKPSAGVYSVCLLKVNSELSAIRPLWQKWDRQAERYITRYPQRMISCFCNTLCFVLQMKNWVRFALSSYFMRKNIINFKLDKNYRIFFQLHLNKRNNFQCLNQAVPCSFFPVAWSKSKSLLEASVPTKRNEKKNVLAPAVLFYTTPLYSSARQVTYVAREVTSLLPAAHRHIR